MKYNHLVFSVLAIFSIVSCNSKHKEHEEQIRFKVTSPLNVDTAIVKDYVCQISSISHIEIRAQERGYLQKIFVDEGQFVKEGQLLFQIMPALYNAEVQKSKAEADLAEIEYTTTKTLLDNDVVSKNELAMAKAKLDKAKAALSLAKVHLQFTQIRAPFNGIIDRFRVRLGSLIDEGDLLTELSDNSKMWVYFNVPESEYLDYKSNADNKSYSKVNLLMANNRMFDYSGNVETIEANFNNETGNIAFRATFPNPKALLRHGETGNIQMKVPFKNALIIPQKATFEILEKKYVLVVDKDNIVKQREVTLYSELPDVYIVKNGITKEDKIIYEGILKAKVNEKVVFDYEKPANVISNLKVYVE